MPETDHKVLVVDDDADIREALRDTLEDEGYQTAEARDGSEALEYLSKNPAPPLILLDWNMAPMNGAEFMARVAEDPALSSIPVILLTADTRAPEKSKSAKFADYLMKPLNLEKLFQILERYCG